MSVVPLYLIGRWMTRGTTTRDTKRTSRASISWNTPNCYRKLNFANQVPTKVNFTKQRTICASIFKVLKGEINR